MKRWWILLILLLLLGGVSIYILTGGMGLIRILKPYLLKDLPDKRYTWTDFLPSRSTNKISGFYSPQLSGENGVAIWTLAGLQRFYHQPQFSVYYHRDVCGVVKAIQLDIEKNAGVPSSSRLGADNEVHFFDIEQWKQNMQAEYFVTVQWVEKDGRRVVDKLWSVSGKYKVLGRVGEGVCE